MMQALDISAQLSQAMGKPFEKHFRVLGSSIVSCLSDQKPQVRLACVGALDTISKVTGMDCMLSIFATSLLPEHSILRKDLLQWMGLGLEHCYGPVEDLPRKKIVDMDQLVQPLVTCLLDKTADVRKAAQVCLKYVIQSYGFEYVRSRASELFKGANLQSITAIIDTLKVTTKAQGPAPVTPNKAKKPAVKSESTENVSRTSTSSLSRPSEVARMQTKSKPPTAPVQSESEVTGAHNLPLLSEDGKDKIQRSERNIGFSKWVFDTPRKDLLDFLQDQCTPHMSPDLMNMLFSIDHYKEKYFLLGLTMLDDSLMNAQYCNDTFGVDLVTLKPKFIANADLILKYLTIRLMDTNTTMIIKCLDLIEHLFTVMDEESYTLSEYEATSFLPYFINKV